jgi:dipeptidyl aminopeptidase/acylaminoacyl peptidase
MSKLERKTAGGRRTGLRAALCLSLGLIALAGHAPAAARGGELEIRQTDYRQDRANFHTVLKRIGRAPQMAPPLAALPGVKPVEFASGELRLRAWVGVPDFPAPNPEGRYPVVIFLHGGFAFGPGDLEMAEPYKRAGFVVVMPMLRGENGQQGAFSLFYDEVDDVLAAAAFVRGLPNVDTGHIYLAGHSVGGTMAMLSGMASSDFKAVVSFSGSPDQIAFCADEPGLVPFDRRHSGEFEMRSPLSYAASLKSPTRLYYGAQEAFFDASTQRMAKIAQAAGLPVDARKVPGDHFGAVPAEIEDSIRFFRAHW